ncbi:glycosyltransferase [Dyadobacter psychrotolerans]|uniref:Glycosyltransferase n=1 Tax=Dyadobacter psychrotolerans TaxID=2541721 RepID=A0A4R5DD14_9BACT|nr:glycosyltransferase [Dyadobacter psychrotolerans]TDE08415.1 glycosyltransferase [Dyadobacter psychrotolerans]
MTLAPVLLFVYNRLDTLKQTVATLQLNVLAPESELFIFSDAAKHEKDRIVVGQIRDYIKTIDGFRRISVCEAQSNKGLAKSIINGVNQVLKEHDQVIVLEDDLLTTPNFLTFMNKSLERYKYDNKVFSISGYSFDLGEIDGEENYLLNRGWSWGWATWSNRWNTVDWLVSDYHSFAADAQARRNFARGGSDLNKMLDNQLNGKLDSWAIRWFYHQFRTGGLTLYPVKSKVYNIGFGERATHTTGSDRRYKPRIDTDLRTDFIFPDSISIHQQFQQRFQSRMGWISRVISKCETLIFYFSRWFNNYETANPQKSVVLDEATIRN